MTTSTNTLEALVALDLAFTQSIQGLTGNQLITLRGEWDSQKSEKGANIGVIDERIATINSRLPIANFRGIKLPEGGLEILPGLRLIHSGKVRNTFVHDDNRDHLIIVATDRISTHDVVHQNEIPGKGEAITAVSDFWFATFREDADTKHIPSQRALDTDGIDVKLPSVLNGYGLEGRTNTAHKLRAFPIEAIVRGFLYGSALKDYSAQTGKLGTGEYVGKGLQKCSQFTEPLFTPSTKGEKDINIDFNDMIDILEKWLLSEGIPTSKKDAKTQARRYAKQIRSYSIKLYKTANKHAQAKGLTLGDTKFEFGLDKNGRVTLIDEVCTPDSSRYWSTASITAGAEPEQFDKQAVRDHVMSEWKKDGEVESKPPKIIPTAIIAIAQAKYAAIQTGFSLDHNKTTAQVTGNTESLISK